MPKFNDFDMKTWKDTLGDVWTDSLWLIDRRDNTGKHSGFYHGNFVPQIPHQFIQRFTKVGDSVLDPFMGSGTTAYECETLGRNFIGIDIKQDMVDYTAQKLAEPPTAKMNMKLICGDSTNAATFVDVGKVQLAILHPPYFDILKFSDNAGDLSNAKTLEEFNIMLGNVVKNCINVLEDGRYLVVVIGDKYSQGQWYPLGFYCINECMKLGLTLKSIIVKNMDGNRAKQGKNNIWRYRALTSDYYLFKHEYLLLFKK